MSQKRNLVLFLFDAVALIVICYILISFLGNDHTQKFVAKYSRAQVQTYTHFSKLDGSGVSNTEQESPIVVGIMIDNHPDARPGSGLSQASVVYEVPVEGEFTRYFALFNASSTVDEVGPVRSARPYFIDWAAEYKALYLHSGGSPDALAILKKNNTGVTDVNEFWNGRYFWRDDTRDAPHNLLTNSRRWQELIAHEGGQQKIIAWQGWQFNKGEFVAPTSSVVVQSITITFVPGYVVAWKHDVATHLYQRFVNGEAMADKQGRNIFATNILVQTIPVKIIDDEGRKDINTVGEGAARVLEYGTLTRGTWKKTGNTRTRFFAPTGEELQLQPGVTWVEIVAPNTDIQIES